MINLRKGVGSVVAAAILAGALPMTASAALIAPDSEAAFFGTFTSVGGSGLADSTGMAFNTPILIAAATSDFAFADGGNATFSSFDFVTPSLGTIISFDNGGAFTATSVDIALQTDTALNLVLDGFWSLDGFDDTAGRVELTADALGGLNTFSAVGIVTVPVPGALLLFGSALIGLGAARRKS